MAISCPPERLDVDAGEPFDVGAFVVVEPLEVVGAGGGVDDHELGLEFDERLDACGCGGVVGFEVVDSVELVVGGAEFAESVAGVPLAHFEVDDDDGVAGADHLDRDDVGGEGFR